MSITQLSQDGADWLAWRNKGIGGSDAPALMRTSPWKDIVELWRDKCGLSAPTPENDAMRRGKHLEKYSRDQYNWDNPTVNMEPKLFEHKKYPFLRASVDGHCDVNNFCIEIKTPGKKDLELAARDKVPKKYYPQLQWIMMVTETKFIDYVTYDGKSKNYTKRIHADPNYIRRMERYARWFWHKVENKIEIKDVTFKMIHIDDQGVE